MNGHDCNSTATYDNYKEKIYDMTKQLKRLEDMMHAESYHSENRHLQQRNNIHDARHASSKHKKPHMTRRIIK